MGSGAFAAKSLELKDVELAVCDICEDTMLFIDHKDFIGESCPLSDELVEKSDYIISGEKSGDFVDLSGKVKRLGKDGPRCFDIEMITEL